MISWGFSPDHVADVLFLKEHGWFVVWFDGDRPAALKSFIARGTVPEAAFYAKMFAIERQRVPERIAPHACVDPFDQSMFRPLDDIVQQLLRLSTI